MKNVMNLTNNKQNKIINLRVYFIFNFKNFYEFIQYFFIELFLFKIFN